LPRASSATPQALSVALGQPLRGRVRVDNETRVKLEGNLAAALANAKSTVTISAEARASAVLVASGREAKVTLEVSAQQAKAVLEAVALQDAARLAPLLDAPASLEARAYQEQGGEASLALSAGVVGGSVRLEAKRRDVDDASAVKVKATLGEALAWLSR
jgi:hypothetical protein